MTDTIFFRLLEPDDKGTALHQAIQQLAQKQPNPNTFAVESESFQQVPRSPFVYWVLQHILSTFVKNSAFQKWKEEILLKEAQPTVFADLGYGVLDAAMVETAAYCLSKEVA